MVDLPAESLRPRVLVVVGTRPEAIKMVSVLQALRRREASIETRLALTERGRSAFVAYLAALRAMLPGV